MRNRIPGFLTFLLFAPLPFSPACAQRLPGDYYNEFHLGYETPHTAWAKPLAGGKVRAFFVAPTHAAREVTELAERLDLVVAGETAIYSTALGDESHYVAQIQGTSNEEKKHSILRKLRQPYEVIVLANFPVAKLPVELQFEILKRVKEGTGLVLTYKREALKPMWRHPLPGAGAIVREVPLAGITFYRTRFLTAKKAKTLAEAVPGLVSGYRLGKGRIALVDYGIQSPVRIAGGFCLTPHEFFTYRTLTEYDYHQSLVAKALLWAAKREPAVRFTDLPLSGFQLPAAAPQSLSVAITNTAVKPLHGRLTIRVRNEWGEVEQTRRVRSTLAPGGNQTTVNVPALPGGTHFLDLTFTADRGVEGWAGAALLVSATPAIAAITPTKLSFERSEPCTGEVELSQPCSGSNWRLELTLLDNYGRRFCRRRLSLRPGRKSVPFTLPLTGSVSLAGRVRAVLLEGTRRVDQKEHEFFVAQRNHDYFPALVWGNLPGIFGHFTGVRLHEAGFNSILHYFGEGIHEGRRPSTIAREDFHAVPYVTRISWANGRLGTIETDTKARTFLENRARQSMPFDPLVYSLGDENFIPPEGGYHPNEHDAFVKFLRRRYPTLTALNDAWGTHLKAFAEAEPVTPTQAKNNQEYVRFHDTEAFREFLYARWHHLCHDIIRRIDPHAKVGAEGSVPGDMEETINGLEFWGPYRRTDQNTLLRSLAPRSLLRGNWFGGYNSGRRDPLGLPRFLWESILDGSTLLEVYCSYTCENFYNTDLTWAPWMHTFLPDLKELTDGLGQLLTRSEHACDSVAVYHSQPSVHFERLNHPFGPYVNAHRAALRMLEDLDYVPYYVTSRQVEAGVLGSKRPRILVLPHTVALSDKEAAAVTQFVRRGGVLLADVRPGILRGNCAPRSEGALDRLLGITKRNLDGQPARKEVTLNGNFSSPALKVRFASTLGDLDVDSTVQAATGVPLGAAGATPVCIVHQVGKGTAVLLNFSLHEYTLTPTAAGDRPFFDVFRALFTGTSLRPRWQVLDSRGLPLPGGRVSAFSHGRAQLLGALPPATPDREKAVGATIRAPTKAHLYDLRQGKYLGYTDRAAVNLRFISATFLSVLPYRVTGLVVETPARAVAGTICPLTIRMTVKGNPAGVSPVFRVNVLGPDGKSRHYYARTLYVKGLRATTAIPFASNDPPGTWQLVVRDVLTGTRVVRSLNLEATP